MRKNILIVEDKPNIQRVLHFILSKEFDVQSTVDGYEAFFYLENKGIPDLIIMDWDTTPMDGKSFLKCLKVSGLYCDIPCFVVSASTNITEELERVPYSVDYCLRKPFDPIKLREAIENIFNTSPYVFVS